MIVQPWDGFIWLVITASSACFKILRDRRVDTHPHLLFSRKASDRNFEIETCCRLILRSGLIWLVVTAFIACFKILRDRSVDTRPHLLFSREASDRNFGMGTCCRLKLRKQLIRIEFERTSAHFNSWKWMEGKKPSSHVHHFPKQI